LKWQEILRFEKEVAIYTVRMAWAQIKTVGRILFIQSTPQIYPFNFLSKLEREQIGWRIRGELISKGIPFDCTEEDCTYNLVQ